MALHRSGVSEPPGDAADWRRLIRGLTSDWPADEPWNLVVDDITKPAFMQPPASTAQKLSDYKNAVETPDELDMLVTSKNHDVKSSVAGSGDANDWAFALVTLQTSEGFSGAGNYGVSRMNGGLGCRPAFSITPSTRPGAHVRRDIEALLECRERLLDEYPMRDDGVALLWSVPWDGAKGQVLQFSELEPFYIEVCRRVRMQADIRGRLRAIRATSKGARIESKALKGMTGDPWTPINAKEGKSLTLAGGGFTYKRVTDYLRPGDWQLPPLFRPTSAESRSPRAMQLVARGMVRGQGKTEGYHERIIPMRERVVKAFGRPGGREDLGQIAQERIEQVALTQRILRHAVSVFAAGGATDNIGDEQRARANPWANQLDEFVDANFFEDLQEEFEVDDPGERHTIRSRWLHGVIDDARRILRDAEESLPCPAIQRYRARVRADSVFEGRIRGDNGFPWLFSEKGGSA